MSLMARVLGKPGVNFTGDFDQLDAALAAEVKPLREHKARILKVEQDRFQKELVRPGATIEGSVPTEVNEAFLAVSRKERATALKFFESVNPSVKADRSRRADAVQEKIASAIDSLKQFQSYDARYAAFAGKCGARVARPQSIENILHSLAEWAEAERRRSAEPPARVEWPENPVRVSD
jgi:hypothetical protein